MTGRQEIMGNSSELIRMAQWSHQEQLRRGIWGRDPWALWTWRGLWKRRESFSRRLGAHAPGDGKVNPRGDKICLPQANPKNQRSGAADRTQKGCGGLCEDLGWLQLSSTLPEKQWNRLREECPLSTAPHQKNSGSHGGWHLYNGDGLSEKEHKI